MPVILSATLDKEGKFKTVEQSSTSYTDYVIYCELKGNSTLKDFDSYEIKNKNSIFYQDNNKSSVYKWLKKSKKQIDKKDEKFNDIKYCSSILFDIML